MESLPKNLPDLEEPFHIFLSTKATKIPRGPTIDVSKHFPGSMLQIDFAFFNVEIICGFTSTFVDICSDTSNPFVFLPRSKHQTLNTLKFFITILRNQDKKVSFIQVDEDGALARSSEFTRTCHNMTIVVQTKGVDAPSINGKILIPNNTLANIKRVLLLN